ncbi:hypothetical protein [Streptomyces sp. NPDC002133]|uniref:hypothetical protein n=1 Tax=Streptomyces sp. NPDC002133 TaxID=3154409 RepID=UPI00332D2683
MPNRSTRRRRFAGMERSLAGFLEQGEHLQHQCTALVNDNHAELLVTRQGELISAVISDRALYLLFNSRRPREATRIAFDDLKRFEQTSPRTITIETYSDADNYVLAPQSAMLRRTTDKFAAALKTWAPNRVVAAHRIELLAAGGATLFQLMPGPDEEERWSWSISFDLGLLTEPPELLHSMVRTQVQEIIARVNAAPAG